ncbi:MAG: hypothetical protein H6581_04705 [Bacteroidia bacterium]|nr:hypothetical protein [Bacteroidia bacterium]
MPVEIKEMIVRAVISPNPGSEELSGGSAHSMGQDEIIAECVKQVLKVLNAKKER